jgi:hypothetical protein
VVTLVKSNTKENNKMDKKFKIMMFTIEKGNDKDEGFAVRKYTEVKRDLTWAEAKAERKTNKYFMITPQVDMPKVA